MDGANDAGKEGIGSSLADAAQRLFPELVDGPDHVWYTLGGNDFADKTYQVGLLVVEIQCMKRAPHAQPVYPGSQ